MKLAATLLAALLGVLTAAAPAADEPFRPEAGKFPPLEKAHSYRGELVFVDHANRRGSIRVQGTGTFRRNDPQPFAMLGQDARKRGVGKAGDTLALGRLEKIGSGDLARSGGVADEE